MISCVSSAHAFPFLYAKVSRTLKQEAAHLFSYEVALTILVYYYRRRRLVLHFLVLALGKSSRSKMRYAGSHFV